MHHISVKDLRFVFHSREFVPNGIVYVNDRLSMRAEALHGDPSIYIKLGLRQLADQFNIKHSMT
jgi:hypothetical protein